MRPSGYDRNKVGRIRRRSTLAITIVSPRNQGMVGLHSNIVESAGSNSLVLCAGLDDRKNLVPPHHHAPALLLLLLLRSIADRYRCDTALQASRQYNDLRIHE
jgi:hypothetical protein